MNKQNKFYPLDDILRVANSPIKGPMNKFGSIWDNLDQYSKTIVQYFLKI